MFPNLVLEMQLGVLVPKEMPAARVFQVTYDSEHRPEIRLGKMALVVQGPGGMPQIIGPGTPTPTPSKPIPSGSTVAVRGDLICRYLSQNDAFYVNGKGRPFLNFIA
jgi:hypothetical protein